MSEAKPLHRPSILVPYPGPEPDPGSLDVFVYLRPETNGMQVESEIFKVMRACRTRNFRIEMVYMANVPGDYIVAHHIVERHYSLRLFFAVHGGSVFTEDMIRQFETFYGTDFDADRVIGAFEALRRFQWNPEDLFGLWVEETAITRIAGQVIKRYRDVWVVNYDIPALLHKNTAKTDIAVMAFRTREGYPFFFELAVEMKRALIQKGILKRNMPIARAIHISRSPFEQLLDARDYLLRPDGTPDGMERSSFAQYLQSNGFGTAQIAGLVEHPICRFNWGVEAPAEQSLLDLCEGFGYDDARNILKRMEAQLTQPRTEAVRTIIETILYE